MRLENNKILKRFCFIDLISSTAPFNFFFIKTLSKSAIVDVYCSETNYNDLFVKGLERLPNVKLRKFFISSTIRKGRFGATFEVFRLYCILIKNSVRYDEIYLNFPQILALDFLLITLLRSKVNWLVHNVDRQLNSIEAFSNSCRFVLFKKLIFLSECGYIQYKRTLRHNEKPSKILSIATHGMLPLNLEKKSKSANWNLDIKNIRLISIGNVKPYKGLIELLTLASELRTKKIKCYIYGKFDKQYLKSDFERTGWLVDNNFQDDNKLIDIVISKSIFILPHLYSTQSGLFYTFLNYRALFIASRCGQQELSFKKFGLEELLFEPGNVKEVISSLNFVINNKFEVIQKFEALRRSIKWEKIKVLA